MYITYGEQRYYTVRAIDFYGNPISGGKITINMDVYTWNYDEPDCKYLYLCQLNYYETTDENGYAYLEIDLRGNQYFISTTMAGTSNTTSGLVQTNMTIADEYIGNPEYEGESLDQYLKVTENAESHHDKITPLAQSLTANCPTDTEKANALYNYVRNEIKYEEYSNTRYGAVYTLLRGSGNCVDQSHLLVALARTVGLPARYVIGHNHVWTQIFIKESNLWIIADPTTTKCWGLGVWNTEYSTEYCNEITVKH